ncbi:MAG: cobalamin biosynthesis protein [archaeon GB-1867-035]|nr:cobalamin biosynthesis protein [Candidatus Culexmicrobium profundum]
MRISIIVILALIVVSPIFGVILADMVGYHEPLDVAAERLGLEDVTDLFNWTPFIDYTVPGLPATIGYIISGLIGIAMIIGLVYVFSKLTSDRL